jgi:hypothetical protein
MINLVLLVDIFIARSAPPTAMSLSLSFDAICAQLDDTFIKYFELYQQLQSVRKAFADHCNEVHVFDVSSVAVCSVDKRLSTALSQCLVRAPIADAYK